MKLDIGFGLGNATWPAFVVDASGNIRHANEAAINTFGSVMEGEPALSSSIWSPEMDLTPEQFLAKTERSSSPMMQLKFRVKGGGTARFNSYVCSFDHDGQKFFLFQVMRDASILSGEGDTVYDSAEAAQRRFESGDTVLRTGAFSFEASAAQRQKLECALQLARTVSLDFNNALTSILGHTSLVLSKAEPNHPWRHSLMEVERAAQKAAEIAQDLAAFSRQEKDPRAQIPGNLNTVLSRAVESFQKPGATRIIWTFHLEKRLFTVNFDEAKTQQAFVKILENAVEAVGPEGRITVRSHNQSLDQPVKSPAVELAAGHYVCVEFADNGCGIPPDVLPRIFEPFFTTKPNPPHRGLGLAWVYGIVTNHGGSLAVTSPPGQGTTVRIFLPAQKKIVRDHTTQIEDLRGNQTVLFVDDDETVVTLGQVVLTSFGYKVLPANSAARALELFSEAGSQIDLVITDLVMPGMSGRELIDHIRWVAPAVPILSTSGYLRPSSDNTEDEYYLRKPFTSHDLLRKVKHALSSVQAGRHTG
jgi:two-component system cell cycle sensor histidine kinase/response regulator CckA